MSVSSKQCSALCIGLFAAFFLLPLSPARAQVGASSSNYTILHQTLDQGGGRAEGGRFVMDLSFGGVGGVSHHPAGTLIRQGYSGQLNDAPLARADSMSRLPDGGGKIAVSELLSNDSDLEGDPIRLRTFDQQSAQGGTLIFDNGWLLYSPPPGWSGADTFGYTIEDSFGGLAAALVAVLVLPIDDSGQPGRNIISIHLSPGGWPVVRFAGVPGRSFREQWTDTLDAPFLWSDGPVLVSGSNGTFEYVDEEPPSETGRRFYRVISVQP